MQKDSAQDSGCEDQYQHIQGRFVLPVPLFVGTVKYGVVGGNKGKESTQEIYAVADKRSRGLSKMRNFHE